MKQINVNFTMSKNFVADTLINFYKGDDSLKNPMKMFVENEAFDKEISESVYGANLGIAKDFFEIDLWLNGLDHLIHGFSGGITNKIEGVLMQRYHGIKTIRYKAHFYEATLNDRQFEFLYPVHLIIREVKKDKPIVKEIEFIGKLLEHKDFPIDARLRLYDETNNDYFLPAIVKDIFLF